MMRKLLVVILSIGFSLVLFGCGGGDDQVPDEVSVEDQAVVDAEIPGDGTSDSSFDVGDEYMTEHGVFTVEQYKVDAAEEAIDPIHMTVSPLLTASVDVHEDFAEIVGSDEIDIVQVTLRVENTSDEVITFDMSEATMVTNTGEEIEKDLYLSDFVADTIYPDMYFHGSFIYMLEESLAEDVESVILTWDAPMNEAGEEMSDEIELEIEF